MKTPGHSSGLCKVASRGATWPRWSRRSHTHLHPRKVRTGMFGYRRAALAVVCSMTWGCGEPATQVEAETGWADQELAGATAAGSIPSGLPARLQVGLFEEHGGS